MARRGNRTWIALAGAALLLAGGAWWLAHRTPPARYETEPVGRGDVATSVTASGSVNPVVTVQVGAFVSGPIKDLACDYNTPVRKGQLCAKIDPQPFQVVVDQNDANVAVARAQLAKDKANLVYTGAARRRAETLFTQDSISRDAVDAARDADVQAQALVGLDEAQLAQRIAQLRAAKINLDYTNIVSPVDGTVVSRNVNVGQTVAASFQTPTLFLIAKDLTKMQVDTNVSESDIAGVQVGSAAVFTVDAFPARTFSGQVTQVRQAPISVQNVITYDAVITVDNPDLALKPGMTATARIVTARSRNVLRVPSQALRFTPEAARAEGGRRDAAQGGGRRHGANRRVWVQRSGKLVPVAVTVGLDDDAYAEIRSVALREGDEVVVAQTAPAGRARPRTGSSAGPRL
jgi:HlyD family secretion protein